MRKNINTRSYWEQRFSSGDWESKQGNLQTESFARGQMQYLDIDIDFEGTILDFGCGLGDAIPVYKEYFPKANLIGMDISQSAIDKCNEKYDSIATFVQGSHESIPDVDIIIASNVFEHLSDDKNIATYLLSKCKRLYVVVPFKEEPLCSEHVNTYDRNSFLDVGDYDFRIFHCVGWSQYGFVDLWFHIYLKNIFRFMLRKSLRYRSMQVMFSFKKDY